MDPERRKRINLYKEILVIMVVTMILLPTILCIILFIKMSFLENELKELKTIYTDKKAIMVESSPQEEPTTQDSNLKPTVEVLLKETINESQTDSLTDAVPEMTLESQPMESLTEETLDEETVIAETKPAISDQERIDQALAEGRKVVYLTFDDGPCANTENLLEVLDRYQVKASFFVNFHTGREKEYQDILKRGHTLAMHTYSHRYENVYGSYDQFVEEVESLRGYLKDVTGEELSIFRFPGGSSNSQTKLPITTFIHYLDDQNIHYFDWNVSSGDGADVTRQQVYDNVIQGINSHDISVVLMHDSEYKMTTFEAVEDILKTLQEMNALILPITKDTTPIQHNIN